MEKTNCNRRYLEKPGKNLDSNTRGIMKLPIRPRVIIRRCPDYNTERIRAIIREGLEELELRPHGRTLVKPNTVASGDTFPHAYTRPEFLEGVLMALKDRASKGLTELAVGERCGITIPTRRAFDAADYYPMFKRTGVKHYHFEEEPQVEIRLSHKERLRDYIFTPQPVAQAEFFGLGVQCLVIFVNPTDITVESLF